MNDNVIYQDVMSEEDPGGNEDIAWRFNRGFTNQEIINLAFKVTGRTSCTFSSQRESRKWHKIDDQFTAGKIPMGFITEIIEWARKMNYGRLGKAIIMEDLATAILNKARMQDWNLKHKDQLRKPSDY